VLLGALKYPLPMLIRHPDEVSGIPVAMEGAKDVSMRLMIGKDDGAPTFAMRHFTVAAGGHTPRHSHPYEHEVMVLSGSGRAEYDGVFQDLRPGEALFVAPNMTHQFVNTGEEDFTFMCLVPVADDCGQPVPAS
jgi:quercetin dioxygenase-like cupin family protein